MHPLPAVKQNSIKFTAVAFVIMLAVMPFDGAILAYVNAHPDCKSIFQIITEAGRSHWYLVPSGLIFLAGLKREWRIKIWHAASVLFLAVASSGIFVNLLKPIFARARPREMLSENISGFFHWPKVLSGHLSDYNSFPSGHAATAISAAVVIAGCLPTRLHALRLLILVAGGIIAVSRVMVSAHYASDVIAGAAIGAWAAVLCKNYLARARWAAAISRPDILQ